MAFNISTEDRIRFLLAEKEDAPALAEVQAHTFEFGMREMPEQGCCGPPETQTPEWQVKMMSRGYYYKIVSGSRLIGGFIVMRLGPSRYELGRLWIIPEFQNRGIGSLVLDYIEDIYPARRWTLDSPAWASRSQEFYEKRGYRKIGEVNAGEGLLYLYEKRV